MINKELYASAEAKQFESAIIASIGNNISSQLAGKVAGLLALDYAHRLQYKPDIIEYLDIISQRLANYLGYRVVLEEEFSIAMALFTVAITPEIDQSLDKITEQEKSVDAAIDAAILEHFSDLSPEEISMMKDILKELVKTSSLQEVMSFISSDPQYFKDLAKTLIREKKQKQEISEFVQLHIQKIILKQKQIKKSKVGLKSLVSKISMTASIVAAMSLGLLTGGLLLPMLAVPLVAVTTRVAGRASDKISQKVVENSKSIKSQSHEVNISKSTMLSRVKEKIQGINISKTKSISRGQALDITEGRIKTQAKSQQVEKTQIIERTKTRQRAKIKGRSR